MSKLLNYLDRLDPGYVERLERQARRDNLEVAMAGQHTHGPRAAISERKACPRCRADWRFAQEMRRVHRSKVHPGEMPVVRIGKGRR